MSSIRSVIVPETHLSISGVELHCSGVAEGIASFWVTAYKRGFRESRTGRRSLRAYEAASSYRIVRTKCCLAA